MPYGMIDVKVFDSAVVSHGYKTVYVFMSMIALANEEHVCDFGLDALAGRIALPAQELEVVIATLCEPDPESRSSAFGGRRIVPMKEMDDVESNRGWFMVNRELYIHEIRKENRKKQVGEAVKRHRSSKAIDEENEKVFLVFWNLYPRKDDKKKARIAFNNLTAKEKVSATKDVEHRYDGVDRQYIPMATTYIHGDRWEDATDEVTNLRTNVI